MLTKVDNACILKEFFLEAVYYRTRLMTYAEQLQVIQGLHLREGDNVTIQCPFCGTPKKLSASKKDGKLMWNCYRASCNGRGIHSGRRDLQTAKEYMANGTKISKQRYKPIPSLTTRPENHPPALDYLASVNSLEAYERGLIEVRYAPAEDRVLFIQGDGAVGRSLSSGTKWLTYGLLPEGIRVGSGSTAVLVEDTPSACSISRLPNTAGIAMLGTTLTNPIKTALNKFNKVYFILDKDASIKAINTRKFVCSHIKVRFTQKDLKCLDVEQIKAVLSA